MYFTKGKQRAFELLMQQKPGFDRYQSGCAGDDEACGTCRFYRPGWKYEFCVFKECPYCPGKRTRKTHASMDKLTGNCSCAMRLCRRENGKGHIAIPKQPKTAF